MKYLLLLVLSFPAFADQPLTPPKLAVSGCSVSINQYALGWDGDVLADTLTKYTAKCKVGRKTTTTTSCEVQKFTDYGQVIDRQSVSCALSADKDAVYSNPTYLTELYTGFLNDYGYRAYIRTRTAFDSLEFLDQGTITIPYGQLVQVKETVTNVGDSAVTIWGTGAYSLSAGLQVAGTFWADGVPCDYGTILQPGESCSYNVSIWATDQGSEARVFHTEVYTDGPTANGYSVEFIQNLYVPHSP